MTKVVKRNGTHVEFNKQKIEVAILKAMKSNGNVRPVIAKNIADEIEDENKDKEIVYIKEIEESVFNKLITKKQRLTARAYEGYRSVREFQRASNTIDENVLGLFNGTNIDALTENSNKNEQLVSTGRDLVAEEVSKDIALRKMLPPHVAQAHREGIIHLHDLGHYMNKSINCLSSYSWVDVRINGKCERLQLKDLYERYEIEPTEDGKIVEVNDKVYIKDSYGWTKIKAIMARETKNNENVYTFKTHNGNHLSCTGKHRIPVMRNNKSVLLNAEDIKTSDKMFYINELNNDFQYFDLTDLSTVTDDIRITNMKKVDKYLDSNVGNELMAFKLPTYKEENVSVDGFEKLPQTEIVSIEKDISKHIVVDVQTESNYFVANNYLVHNCCLVNLKDMLDNGTCINEKLIESPHKFSTACNIATQIIAQVASGQFGGQTITLSHLSPYLRKTKKRIEDNLNKELKGLVSDDKIQKLVNDRLQEELTAGVQTFNYQINTLLTSNGQSPFLSVFMYIEEDPEYEEETALITEEFLKQRLQGMKNEVGAWITPAFPKLLYVTTPNNIYEGSKYYYITELAAKCVAKRMMPDLISEKHMKLNYEGNVFPCMGCRAWLSPYKGGINNIDGQYKWYGRFNMGLTSINLADCGLSAEGDIDKFWEIFDERLDLVKETLLLRYNNIKDVTSDASPIHFQYGAIARLKKGEPIAKLLQDGYATISLGLTQWSK